MENEFILTSAEFAKLTGISNESLRSRRRRGMYHDQYVLKNKSYLWKKPRPIKVGGPHVRDASRLSAHASNTNNISASHLPLQPRCRNKNSRNHHKELQSAANGSLTKYPNAAFKLANEFKMVAKAQRKISAAAAEEITEDVIRIAEDRRRNRLLEATKPIKIRNYTTGIYDARNEPISRKQIKYSDETADEEMAFWSKRYY